MSIIHQLRIYEIFEHNKAAFHDRFRDHAARIMKTYGFHILAVWETQTEARTEFVYLLAWPDDATMQSAWEQFMADEEWKEIKRVTRAQHGDLVGEIESRVLVPASYSPLPESAEDPSLIQVRESAAAAAANAQLAEELQRAKLAKSEFVAFVAHELKNPMTSIKGYAELLASGAPGQINEMQADFLSTIRSNVERMSTLVSDLNVSAKIEANRLRLDFKPVNIPESVDEVVSAAKRPVESKGQTLELRLSAQLPLAWADQFRVSQILTNLVSNAHKYTPEGGHIQIGAEVLPNQWDPNGARQVVHFWVKDNGIGISIEDQAKIFQKFFRSDDAAAREEPGTGLGLNITKSLVEMMGGRIWFESEFRKGTTFHFTVPVAEG
ncbi:MAG TPA: ATP-binding protein [Anaerolineales bacterium]|nr:ATP-binding protein [Anaerolineales bacterium]